MTEQEAAEGDKVLVHYTGRLDDGQVIGSSRNREPVSFTIGSGQMIAGFDTGITGLTVGQSRTVSIEPADAFGEYDTELVMKVPRVQAPDGLRPRDRVTLGDRPATVVCLDNEHIVVDTNHPLAGETLTVDLQLVAIVA
jgi:peptidylprolyl isomerase